MVVLMYGYTLYPNNLKGDVFMRDLWKKAAAAALSFALLGGALPANVGGLNLFDNGLIADAGVYRSCFVYYDANGGSGSMPSRTIPAGTLSFMAPDCTFTPPDYMVFDKWMYSEDQYFYRPGEYLEIGNNTEYVRLSAQWKRGYTKVSFYANGGTGNMSPIAVPFEVSIFTAPECTITPPNGKTFDKWLYNGKYYNAGENIPIGNNISEITLAAQWKDASCKIRFNGANNTQLNDVTLPEGQKYYKLPEFTYELPAAKYFTGWRYNDIRYNVGDTITPKPGWNYVYAVFANYPKTITFTNNGGTGTMDPVTITTDKYTLPQCTLTPPAGKRFYYWSYKIPGTSKTFGDPGESVNISDLTEFELTPEWKNLKAVTFNANGGTGTMDTVYVEPWDSYKLPECTFTPPKYKTFDKWDKGSVGSYVTIGYDTELKALWKDDYENYPVIQLKKGDYGDGEEETIQLDADVTKFKLPECCFEWYYPGYKFSGWEYDSKPYKPGQTITIKKGINTVTATWKKTDSCAEINLVDPVSGKSANYFCEDDAFTLPKCPFTAPKGKKFAGYEAPFSIGTLLPGEQFPPEGLTLPYEFRSSFIWYLDIVWEDVETPKFTTNSMTLGGAISLNFYVDLSCVNEEWRDLSWVEFEVGDKKQTAEFNPKNMNQAKTAYGFTCMLNSVSMADDVKATLHYYDDEGNEQTVTTTSTAESYLKKFDEGDGEKLWGLISSINDYGYYMQKYLSVHSGKPWTLDVDHTAMETNYTKVPTYKKNLATYKDNLSKKAKVKDIVSADLSNISYSLVLDADTSLNITIKPQSNYKGNVKVTLDGKSVTPKKVGNNYVLTIPGISAHKLGDTYSVTVKTTNGTSTFKASALSYANDAINDPYDDSEVYAMCALYDYYQAAVNYIS